MRLICCVLVCVVFVGCAAVQPVAYTGNDAHYAALCNEESFVNAVFVSYLDYSDFFGTGDLKLNVRYSLERLSVELGVDTVIFQVRPFCDAMYRSQLFPTSKYWPRGDGDIPCDDPLRLLTEQAEQLGMRVCAWVNPYRIGAKTAASSELIERLRADDPLSVVEYGGSLYLNPSCKTAAALIIGGVRELAQNYRLSAVLFDDYFYPTTDLAFDAESYALYTQSGGDLPCADWRRESVSALIGASYSAVKEAEPEMLFGISPDANIERNYERHYADVAYWCEKTGYLDFVCPQIYFGFDNSSLPFEETLSRWVALCEKNATKLVPALAFYKVGSYDKYARTGAYEWTQSFDIISRQYRLAAENCAGVAYYRFSSLLYPSSEQSAFAALEIYNIQENIKR